ncbi:response regulator [uncultured Aquimarina sp.]|uniref:response regulator n=1 Tax=uncultured Aquimarina sp. TaxID=575652 RepID=UPI002613BBD1|nr:response regulator [uncultured Aquimarina sp.]
MNDIVTYSLLIDDDKATNFFNKRMLLKHKAFKDVKVIQEAKNALEYLKNINNQLHKKPELIFLDINMPFMNGWDFLEEFANLEKDVIDDIKIIMLSTSNDPNDIKKALKNELVYDFINKPLSNDVINQVIGKHFSYKIAR